MWSKPKETWAEWRLQKRRHLNVGKYYKTDNKIRLGLLTGSHVLAWLLALVVLCVVLVHELLHHSFTQLEWLLLLSSTGVFVFRLLLFWGIVGRISYRLAHTVHWGGYAFYGCNVSHLLWTGRHENPVQKTAETFVLAVDFLCMVCAVCYIMDTVQSTRNTPYIIYQNGSYLKILP